MKGTPDLRLTHEVGERVRIKSTGALAEIAGWQKNSDGQIVEYAVHRGIDLRADGTSYASGEYTGQHSWHRPDELERVR